MVAHLSSCLDDLSGLQERVLVLRTGFGAARPHSRRAVARRLDLRVRRVRRIERKGLREARALASHGVCSSGSGSGSGSGSAAAGGGSTSGGGVFGGLLASVRTLEDAAGGGGGSSSSPPHSSSSQHKGGGSGDVRDEAKTQEPPPIDSIPTRPIEPGGLSMAIGIGLILLALVAGFATPHVRARLRSGRPA